MSRKHFVIRTFAYSGLKDGMPNLVGVLALILLFLAATSPAWATDYTAASCSRDDVHAKLRLARSSGDRVLVPAGTCTWSSGRTSGTISWTSPPNFTLQGAGVGVTTIIDGINRSVWGDNEGILNISHGGGVLRITGFTFSATRTEQNVTSNGSMRVFGNGTSQFRFDHNTCDNVRTICLGLFSVIGVADHNTFDTSSITGSAFKFYGQDNAAWAAATGLGTSNFFFIEDNTFNGLRSADSATEDCYQGGRFVVRKNALNRSSGGTHPTGGSGQSRGCRAWEVYENIIGISPTNAFNFFFMSSGTGVIWGNSKSGSASITGYDNFVTMHSTRRNKGTYSQTPTPNGWGYCGTTQTGTGANWDQNSNPATGYACLDQPGRGVGDLLSGSWPKLINATTGCNSSQSCAWPRQALEPVYEWSNPWTSTGGRGGFWNVYDRDVLVPNQDYYLYTASFNGTSGVGAGLLSARPSTCTPKVAYWATDTRTLYQCSSTNTWSVYYQPYTYPHPLLGTSLMSR